MRDPCPYCGIPYVTDHRVEGRKRILVRDIEDHDCSAFAPVEPLPPGPTDVSFIAEARNTQEGLERWRKSLR